MANKKKSDLVQKDVSLVGRDFGEFRKNLIEFSKNYFPNTYNDFNESSPGMMFMEMASYVGDVLSFYTDTQLRESLLSTAEENVNLFNIVNSLGYKPKNIIPASVTMDVFQLVPATGVGDNVKPDFDYAMTVGGGMIVGSTDYSDVEFTTIASIDFAFSSSFNPTEISVYQIDENTNQPVYYLLKKQIKATSGKEKVKTFNFTAPKIYDKIKIEEENLVRIKNITDSDGDTWTRVPYLAQDTVFEQIDNNEDNSTYLHQYSGDTPYLLELNRVPKRYITNFEDDGIMVIGFGAGISSNADEEIIPNPDNVGSALYAENQNLDTTLDPSNFLYTKTYGVAPQNTTLTVTYLIGNGIVDNVPAGDLVSVVSSNTIFKNEINLNKNLVSFCKQSIACSNPNAAVGGKTTESQEEIRQNAMAFFAAQNRTVTREDYVMRCYALPPQFGSVAKAYLVQDYQLENSKVDGQYINTEIPNPLALNLYTCGYDNQKNLTALNPATKYNLKTYISYHRLLTDAVNIKDAHIVNIGVNFEIVVLPEFNSNEVLLRAIDRLKSYFDIDNWRINEPINLSKLYVEIDKVDGVQTVVRPDKDGKGGLQIINKFNGNYSSNKYSIINATKGGVIFPPKDPSIFEVKFPNTDIRGQVITQQF
jgi:hypothetical protein|tara:strand:+ start:4782 stop:6722 length:1941 start_codon:yes stop_codon:yes gene_type:complete